MKGVEVSTRPASWPEACASSSAAATPSNSPLGGTSSQERGIGSQERVVIDPGPRELTSRYSGITVQHARTSRGVKVAVTLQKLEWAADGVCQMATAELKTYDRMREIKARDQDSEQFAAYLKNSKLKLQEAKQRNLCFGRLHQRGKVSAWLYDTLVIASFDQDQMATVMLYLEGEEYIIDMDQELTDNQKKYYTAQGRHGDISTGHAAPKLDDLPLQKFGG